MGDLFTALDKWNAAQTGNQTSDGMLSGVDGNVKKNNGRDQHANHIDKGLTDQFGRWCKTRKINTNQHS